jgi:hypothetical protein
MQFDEARTKAEDGKLVELGADPATRANWDAFFDIPNVGFVICDESLRYVKINDALCANEWNSCGSAPGKDCL